MNNTITVVGIFALLMVSVTMFILAFAKPKQKEDINVRLEKLKTQNDYIEDDITKKEKYSKVTDEFNKLTNKLAPIARNMLSPKAEETLNTKLIKAGKYNTNAVNFVSFRLLSAIIFPVLFISLGFLLFEMTFQDALIAALVLAGLGYVFPMARLNRQIDDRHKAIFRSLPDVLDLLTICLEAGMGINEALNKVVEKSREGALRDEIERTLREIQLGNPRLQALRDLAKRVDLKELSSVIVSIVQAEQMGTSLSKTLKVQSEIIREIRWQKAQEMAQKAPVKIIIPIALFIFPTIFIVIFGPLVIGFISGNQ